ncbi:signal peptide peptidase [Anaeramoeba flamelloides]|uniref:Signal peptide peptidase n=1 Tax=Anaeramoeba flamelloides TaxID=1746091 RepID=A0AAV7ZLF8_9EUKA|nr:signal peptide peptidase [Anaeramoeba flamelloides]
MTNKTTKEIVLSRSNLLENSELYQSFLYHLYTQKSFVLSLSLIADSFDFERIALSFFHLGIRYDCILGFIQRLLELEFLQKHKSGTILRSNSITTFLCTIYTRYICMDYFEKQLKGLIHGLLCDITLDFEIDPFVIKQRIKKQNLKESELENILKSNRNDLLSSCTIVFEKICLSKKKLPDEIQIICYFIFKFSKKYQLKKIEVLIGSYLFLRFYNPILINPTSYGFLPDISKPSQKWRRNMVLLTKLLQNLSNGTKFPKMNPLNYFNNWIDQNLNRMKEYLISIASNGKKIYKKKYKKREKKNDEIDKDVIKKDVTEEKKKMKENELIQVEIEKTMKGEKNEKKIKNERGIEKKEKEREKEKNEKENKKREKINDENKKYKERENEIIKVEIEKTLKVEKNEKKIKNEIEIEIENQGKEKGEGDENKKEEFLRNKNLINNSFPIEQLLILHGMYIKYQKRIQKFLENKDNNKLFEEKNINRKFIKFFNLIEKIGTNISHLKDNDHFNNRKSIYSKKISKTNEHIQQNFIYLNSKISKNIFLIYFDLGKVPESDLKNFDELIKKIKKIILNFEDNKFVLFLDLTSINVLYMIQPRIIHLINKLKTKFSKIYFQNIQKIIFWYPSPYCQLIQNSILPLFNTELKKKSIIYYGHFEIYNIFDPNFFNYTNGNQNIKKNKNHRNQYYYDFPQIGNLKICPNNYDIIKINVKGKKQRRFLKLTKYRLLNIDSKSYLIKNFKNLSQISKIVILENLPKITLYFEKPNKIEIQQLSWTDNELDLQIKQYQFDDFHQRYCFLLDLIDHGLNFIDITKKENKKKNNDIINDNNNEKNKHNNINSNINIDDDDDDDDSNNNNKQMMMNKSLSVRQVEINYEEFIGLIKKIDSLPQRKKIKNKKGFKSLMPSKIIFGFESLLIVRQNNKIQSEISYGLIDHVLTVRNNKGIGFGVLIKRLILIFLNVLFCLIYASKKSYIRWFKENKGLSDEQQMRDPPFTITNALIFPVVASIFLIVLFFFLKKMEILLVIYMVTISFTSLTLNLKFVLDERFGKQTLTIFNKTMSKSKFYSIAITVLLMLWWVFKSDTWLINNIIGTSLILLIITVVRIDTLRTVSTLFVLLLLYDVFWVFISPYLFSENVMVKVAQSSGANFQDKTSLLTKIIPNFLLKILPNTLEMPIKLMFPKSFSKNSQVFMLGLGDIAIPGFLLSLLWRNDMFLKHTQDPNQIQNGNGNGNGNGNENGYESKNQNKRHTTRNHQSNLNQLEKEIQKKNEHNLTLDTNEDHFSQSSSSVPEQKLSDLRHSNHFLIMFITYFISLFLCFAIARIYDSPQPALLYIVPFMLAVLYWRAKNDEKLALLWKVSLDEIFSQRFNPNQNTNFNINNENDNNNLNEFIELDI